MFFRSFKFFLFSNILLRVNFPSLTQVFHKKILKLFFPKGNCLRGGEIRCNGKRKVLHLWFQRGIAISTNNVNSNTITIYNTAHGARGGDTKTVRWYTNKTYTTTGGGGKDKMKQVTLFITYFSHCCSSLDFTAIWIL